MLFIKKHRGVISGVLIQTLKHFGVHASHALGRMAQAFAFRIFANRFEDHTDTSGDFFLVNRSGGSCRVISSIRAECVRL